MLLQRFSFIGTGSCDATDVMYLQIIFSLLAFVSIILIAVIGYRYYKKPKNKRNGLSTFALMAAVPLISAAILFLIHFFMFCTVRLTEVIKVY